MVRTESEILRDLVSSLTSMNVDIDRSCPTLAGASMHSNCFCRVQKLMKEAEEVLRSQDEAHDAALHEGMRVAMGFDREDFHADL